MSNHHCIARLSLTDDDGAASDVLSRAVGAGVATGGEPAAFNPSLHSPDKLLGAVDAGGVISFVDGVEPHDELALGDL